MFINIFKLYIFKLYYAPSSSSFSCLIFHLHLIPQQLIVSHLDFCKAKISPVRTPPSVPTNNPISDKVKVSII